MSAGENNCYRAFYVRLISQIFLIAQYAFSVCNALLSGKTISMNMNKFLIEILCSLFCVLFEKKINILFIET